VSVKGMRSAAITARQRLSRSSDDGISVNDAESYFNRLRRAECGIHHRISGQYLYQHANEMAWREDNRRIPNGMQFRFVTGAALHHPEIASLVRLLAEGRSVSKDHVVAGLVEKRRELAGIIDKLQRRLDQHRADLTHINGVLRVLATDLDPETIRPKRIYRRNRYFARNELSRLCLSVLRTAADQLLSTDDIAGRVISAKGFDTGDAILRTVIREQVGSTVKRLHREGSIDNIGAGCASKWKLATLSHHRD
jgi:ISXO2-like transposase domain